jgi:hypothetical protein
MAILISGTKINDDREVVSSQNRSSKYTEFAPVVQTISSSGTINIQFDGTGSSFIKVILTGNATFTHTKSFGMTGEVGVLLLDTSINSYTPTFPSEWGWPGGSAPVWADSRYWVITIVGAGGGGETGRALEWAFAVGYGSTGGSETVALEGTSSVPVGYNGQLPVNSLQESGYQFTSDGNINRKIYSGGVWTYTTYSTTEWNNTTPSTTYYIRGTLISKVTTGTPDPDDGEALSTWHALSSNVRFISFDTRASNSYGPSGWTIKVEIATDSGGSNIIATGYYSVTYEGGA